MNKKLDITPSEYQNKIRQQAKARTKRFREEQEKRGYKNVAIYLSEEFRSELERLSSEQGLNRQAAMDHIFDVYQQAVTNHGTSNVILSSDKTVESPVKSGLTEKQINIPGVEPETESADFADLPDKASTIKLIAKYRAAGDSWPVVAEKLNGQGITTARGSAWSKANAQIFYSRNK